MSNDAREKARQLAAKQARNNPSVASRRWIQFTVLAVVLVIVVVAAFVYLNNQNKEIPPSGAVPASANEYGGIVINKDGIVKDASKQSSRDINQLGSSSTSVTAAAEGQGQGQNGTKPLPLGLESPEDAKKNGKPVHVVVFQDFNCPHCKEFEESSSEEIKRLVQEGSITVEYRNMTIMDRGSSTQYSARTANAAYAVANQVSADKYLEFQKEIFDNQHKGNDLNNQQISDIATKYGANISSDLNDNKWRPLVNVVNKESLNNGVEGTPAIYADGDTFDLNANFSGWIKEKIEAKKKQ